MSSKNYKIVSVSVTQELHNTLKESSKRLGYKSVSLVIRKLIDKCIKIIDHDPDEIPVVLTIPAHLKDNPEKLKIWLEKKANGIIQALCKD